jgi:hypothetical protein
VTEKLKRIKVIHGLWVQPKDDTEIVEKGNTLTPEVYAELSLFLEAIGNTLYRKYGADGASYLVAVCPKCNGILGQMCMSPLVICLNCGREFQLTEYKRPPKKTI